MNETHALITNKGVELPQYEGMGTTFVGMFSYEERIYMVNIGDSRLYRYRGGILKQLSSDSTSWERSEGRSVIKRSNAWVANSLANSPLPVRLVCSAAGIRLGLGNGAVIGRRKGDYVSAFASQGYVSGTHARLQKSASGQWEIVDLDSTNGTFVNGNRLSPNVPAVFSIGDIVRIANLDFKVE